ncbi:hypothetical protein PZB74_06960 [Porifericola rhodea]|uniref:hypothetical protein n=1 Tax=Porifericola rhodea TaxID=930972 RepID=UPI0026651725|nr:hypothetical protein [Porifericola rhodea]WKN33082.1 hypothetical protein PZB74_06960 [Porifericola rhodea]
MKFSWVLKFVFFAVAIALAFSLAVMFLWNWLVPEIFNGPRISFIQAIGLLALAKVLVGFGSGGWGGRRRFRRQVWKKKFQRKWEQMTPEEKEKFKHSFMGRCYKDRNRDKMETA